MRESLAGHILREKLNVICDALSRCPEEDAKEMYEAVEAFERALVEAERKYLLKEDDVDG